MILVPKASCPKLKINLYLMAKKEINHLYLDSVAKIGLGLVHLELGEVGVLVSNLGVPGVKLKTGPHTK